MTTNQEGGQDPIADIAASLREIAAQLGKLNARLESDGLFVTAHVAGEDGMSVPVYVTEVEGEVTASVKTEDEDFVRVYGSIDTSV